MKCMQISLKEIITITVSNCLNWSYLLNPILEVKGEEAAIRLEINCDADAATLAGPPFKRSCTIDFESCSCERYIEEVNILSVKKYIISRKKNPRKNMSKENDSNVLDIS